MMRDEILITVCTAVCCGLWLHYCCMFFMFFFLVKEKIIRIGSKDLEGEYVGGGCDLPKG